MRVGGARKSATYLRALRKERETAVSLCNFARFKQYESPASLCVIAEMTFGFGIDTDEVNGFPNDSSNYIGSDLLSTASPSSGITSLELPPPARTQAVVRPKLAHPKFDPAAIRCDYCKQCGHSLDYCPKRLENNYKVAMKWCTQGWHSPKLHDDRRVWRCKFCAMHLHEEYVWEVYPKECMKEEEKFFKHRLQIDKYMA